MRSEFKGSSKGTVLYVLAINLLVFTVTFSNHSWLMIMFYQVWITSILFLLFKDRMNYFLVANQKLTVKNSWLPWKQRVFEFKEIENVRRLDGVFTAYIVLILKDGGQTRIDMGNLSITDRKAIIDSMDQDVKRLKHSKT